MGVLDETIDLLEKSIDELYLTEKKDIYIKEGYDEEIDLYRKNIDNSHCWLSRYQTQVSEKYGQKNLKIKFNSQLGYFIELPKSKENILGENFTLRQSLTQSLRFSSPELEEYWSELQISLNSIDSRQSVILKTICNSILIQNNYFLNLSKKIAFLDFYTNAAYISKQKGYVRPEITSDYQCNILGGKHPVISDISHDFVKNDLDLQKNEFIHVITGPNMGGKSTFLRQNALLILMAQVGFNIPADSAKIGIVDAIFSRVGAGDNLYLGQSTFMVEMQEISYILRHASDKSFIIIDEIGRGTSTYDGMSLAWSILRYLQKNIKSKTLFATHYHEIIDKVYEMKGVENYSVAVGENEKNLVFLRKIIPGGIKKSYGIHVANLAGIPDEVLKGAKDFMQDISSDLNKSGMGQLTLDVQEIDYRKQSKIDEIIRNFEKIDINNTSPLEALSIILDFQKQIKKTK